MLAANTPLAGNQNPISIINQLLTVVILSLVYTELVEVKDDRSDKH
jgi:hypothetical protein